MNFPIASVIAISTLIVLLAFPKAGVYAGNIPLTAGYALLALTGLLQLIRLANRGGVKLRADYVFLGLMFLLLGVLQAGAFSMYGTQSLGSAISIVASTLIVPCLALLSVHWLVDTLGLDRFMRTLRIALLIVFVFGIASFAVYNTTGKVIGIPFVTTTGADVSLVADRHNLRGSMIKMFSTYNNGNILGVNVLIWGAVAAAGTTFSLMQFRSICVLTLSRSVWLGLAAMELAHAFLRRSVRGIAYSVAFVVLLTVVVAAASISIGRDPTDFLLDANLGGRVASFQENLYRSQKVGWTNESLYAASYLALGPLGAILLVATWVVPIVRGGTNRLQTNCRVALGVYMFVAAAEAAFNLVPTQASYWMIAGLAMGAGQDQAATRADDNKDAPLSIVSARDRRLLEHQQWKSRRSA